MNGKRYIDHGESSSNACRSIVERRWGFSDKSFASNALGSVGAAPRRRGLLEVSRSRSRASRQGSRARRDLARGGRRQRRSAVRRPDRPRATHDRPPGADSARSIRLSLRYPRGARGRRSDGSRPIVRHRGRADRRHEQVDGASAMSSASPADCQGCADGSCEEAEPEHRPAERGDRCSCSGEEGYLDGQASRIGETAGRSRRNESAPHRRRTACGCQREDHASHGGVRSRQRPRSHCDQHSDLRRESDRCDRSGHGIADVTPSRLARRRVVGGGPGALVVHVRTCSVSAPLEGAAVVATR